MAKLHQLNKTALIQALQSGETKVVEVLYTAYQEWFFRWAGRRFQANRQNLEDAWQEAITAFFEQVTTEKLTTLRSTPQGWLFAVGYRQLAKSHRKTKRIFWRDAIDEALLKDEQLLDFQWDEPAVNEWAMVEKAMQSISPQCREMLAQRFYQGKKIPDIQAAFGHNSENTTSATLSRCLNKLKEAVNAEQVFFNGK